VLFGVPTFERDPLAPAVPNLPVDEPTSRLGLPEDLLDLQDGHRVGGVQGASGIGVGIGDMDGADNAPRLLEQRLGI
jgi:hypothetical protein